MHKIMFIIGLYLSVYLFPAQQTDYVKDILKLMEANRSEDIRNRPYDQMAMNHVEGNAKIGKESIQVARIWGNFISCVKLKTK